MKNYDVMIVDSFALLFRGYFASAAMREPSPNRLGQYTNGLQQFLRYLLDALQTFGPAHVCCAYDAGSKTFRNELYDGYKSNRPEPPEALRPQFDGLWELTTAMGLPGYRVAGYEADDLIGTLARQAAEQGLRVAILTGDGDALQLIDAQTDVILLKKGFGQYAVVDEQTLPDYKGIQRASQIVDLKALMGDASDMIPGCPKIGEKTGLQLLAQFETIDQLYERIEEVAPRYQALLREHHDQVRMSHRLAMIHCEAPIEPEVPFTDRYAPTKEQLEAALEAWALEKSASAWWKWITRD
jgi:5'-3' exonuclease